MWIPRNTLGGVIGALVGMGVSLSASAADLPAHDPLRILVVSDEVNPHGLPDDQLTQPGDLETAFSAPGSGLNIDDVVEVDSQCIDEALMGLADPEAFDVVVYFAHLAALGCDGSAQQDALTGAFEAHLQGGGGIVMFHHGVFQAGGKEGVLQLLGAQASSVAWDTGAGQDVIATAPEHVVAEQGVEYAGMRDFDGAGVAAGSYPFFNNTPDERYDAITLLEQEGEDRTILFTSAELSGAAPRVLGYDLHRPGWGGHVVFYQPGEHQPQALDDLDGNNFQILANAILYAAATEEEGGGTIDPDSDGDGSGGPSGETSGADDSDGEGMTGGEASAGVSGGVTEGGTGDASAQSGDDGGCGCRSGGPARGLPWLWALAGLGLARRRRRVQRCMR
ncbi:MAG: MYXO-CTERM sorting domain-containing protein [Myxococcota bacterium]